ncbi:MAG: two-component system LytT family response regulator [Crocinitomix sp.]|jgi:two-component system LytT family response regulator
MELIKAIIVDDEQDARKVLTALINFSDYPVQIIASCSSLETAVIEINRLKPAVVFLDIQMPNYAGYEIVNFFDEIDFEIVFVTAYEKYALKAFE